MSDGDDWIAVDIDGTLAMQEPGPWDGSIGAPIPAMVERVKTWLAEGKEVRIYTARVWPLGTHDEAEVSYRRPEYDDFGGGGLSVTRTERAMEAVIQYHMIQAWCLKHFGRVLPVTCIKDPKMIEQWDDRAVQVVKNTGRRADECGAGGSQ